MEIQDFKEYFIKTTVEMYQTLQRLQTHREIYINSINDFFTKNKKIIEEDKELYTEKLEEETSYLVAQKTVLLELEKELQEKEKEYKEAIKMLEKLLERKE